MWSLYLAQIRKLEEKGGFYTPLKGQVNAVWESAAFLNSC